MIAAILFAATVAAAQLDASNTPIGPDQPRGMEPFSYKGMIEKQRMLRRKKQHEAMLERANELLELSAEIEHSFDKHNMLTSADMAKLSALEKNLVKIRKELGGDDVDDRPDEVDLQKKSFSFGEAVRSLRENTISLVDELQKTTRFSISAVAIQSSNSLLKMVRFLRLKK